MLWGGNVLTLSSFQKTGFWSGLLPGDEFPFWRQLCPLLKCKGDVLPGPRAQCTTCPALHALPGFSGFWFFAFGFEHNSLPDSLYPRDQRDQRLRTRRLQEAQGLTLHFQEFLPTSLLSISGSEFFNSLGGAGEDMYFLSNRSAGKGRLGGKGKRGRSQPLPHLACNPGHPRPPLVWWGREKCVRQHSQFCILVSARGHCFKSIFCFVLLFKKIFLLFQTCLEMCTCFCPPPFPQQVLLPLFCTPIPQEECLCQQLS